MKRVKIAEFKNRLSEHLRAVERGAEIEITDRDRPIARVSPTASATAVNIIPARRPFSDIRTKRYRKANWPVRSLDLLLEERQKP
jgi:prevent-host-death family protein